MIRLLTFLSVVLLAIQAIEASGVRGVASWYGEKYRGKIMANGQPFNPEKLTCASNHYLLGTRLLVQSGRKKVQVVVTDRGPDLKLNRQLDLSRAAFQKLA